MVGTSHMLLPELHLWTESVYFIHICEQVFISALHLCVQFIQMLKYICHVCQSCTLLITCKQFCIIAPLICLAFTRFFIRITSFNTEARSAGKVLARSASRCKKQRVMITSGCLCFTRLTNPLVHPTMAATPSVQTLMQFYHISPPCSRYSDATWNPVGETFQELFSDSICIHKTHIGQKLSMSTDIRRLIKL